MERQICNAHLFIGDDFGDNRATMRCQLETGHAGKHVECFRQNEETHCSRNVRVEWEGDDRETEQTDADLEFDVDPSGFER